MDHNRAAETHAVERYLLGDMPPVERDDFEEHYFVCVECGAEVRAAARFRASAREVLREPEQFSLAPEARTLSWWRTSSFLPLAASILLFGVVVYQGGVQIPGLKRQLASQGQSVAQASAAFSLHETTRGAETAQITRIPRGSGGVTLYFDIVSDVKPPLYECTITDATGKTLAVTTVETPKADASPGIELRRGSFPPGRYHLTVRGSGTAAVSANPPQTYEFEVF